MITVPAAELDVATHAGKPLPTDGIFLTPPPEIGKVLSASTSMRPGKLPWFDVFTAVVSGILMGGGCFLLLNLFRGFNARDEPLHLALGGLVFVLTVIFKFPLPCVRYVGSNGLYHWGNVFGKEQVQGFTFEPSSQVRVSLNEMRINGVPTGTDYLFEFTTAESEKTFRIGGRYFDFLNKIPNTNDVHFGHSAVRALAAYLHPLAQKSLMEGKSVRFAFDERPFGKDAALELTRSGLIFHRGDTEKSLALTDFQKAEICNGTVTLLSEQSRPGVLGLGRNAFLEFPLCNLNNASLFLQLLHELTAVQRQQKAA